MIKKGVQWRVGNGSLIRINHENWLPNPYNKRMVPSRDFLHSDAQVSVPINWDQRCWIKEAIDNIFLPHEAALIQSILLNLSDCEDKLFWSHTPDGTYSVRSRYKVLMEEELKDESPACDLTPTRSLWKGI